MGNPSLRLSEVLSLTKGRLNLVRRKALCLYLHYTQMIVYVAAFFVIELPSHIFNRFSNDTDLVNPVTVQAASF